jgi:steroid 5-alpha reductase family enzyme
MKVRQTEACRTLSNGYFAEVIVGGTLNVFGTTLAATAALMLVVWLLSLVKNDASIVDIFWGLGFVLIAGVCYSAAAGYHARKVLIMSLAAVWGLRLALHIFLRNRGKGEDYRYQAMRRRFGQGFPIVSLFTVFGLQGVLLWIISLPLQIPQISREPARLTWLDWTGAFIWLIGFLFESVGDLQLTLFKVDRKNKGKVMDRGLWRYTRHPNYFGDALLWWGFFVIALSTPSGKWTVIGPLIMTGLLIKVSGVALLEKTLTKTKPGYSGYVRRTSAFFPWMPRG